MTRIFLYIQLAMNDVKISLYMCITESLCYDLKIA